ncbi:MAG: PAS domain S-box protein, partial [FCB group bacterium]|nr:PAS domain S-box protein [FCB group bacterium]
MAGSIFIGLIQNIAVLLAFTLIYEYLWNKNEDIGNYPAKIITGIIIGMIGIFLMYTPWELVPGLVFDTRSVLLSISGLFFGAIPTIIAIGITAAYRIYMGGSGMYMGVAVVLTAGSIGLLWSRFFPPRKMKRPALNLLLLGFIVHLVMLFCAALLPKDVFLHTLRTIALPLLTIYTPGTMLLGLLMLKRWSIWQTRKEKEESEKKYRDLVENAAEAIIVTQDAFIRFANGQALDVLGYPEEKIMSEPFVRFIHPDDRQQVMKRYTD